MQYLGKDLEYYVEKYKKLSVKTVCQLAYQMINLMEYIHEKHIIHRDIKPDNFVMGINQENDQLYIIDFGLAKKYRSSKTLEQLPLTNKRSLTGTARYASVHAMEGLEQSRRDDLEGVMYVLIYLLRGNLPWQGLKIKSKEGKMRKILKLKAEYSSQNLCYGFPKEFQIMLDYCKKLEYKEKPDYEMIKSLICQIMESMNEEFDYVYDWTTKDDIENREEVKKNSVVKQKIDVEEGEMTDNREEEKQGVPEKKGKKEEKDCLSPRSDGERWQGFPKSSKANNVTIYKANNDNLKTRKRDTVLENNYKYHSSKDEKAESSCCIL